jgi:hypothetical protein
MRFGEILDPNFSIDHVCFSPEQFFALLRTNLPIGSVVLYDEAGVGSNSRDALTKTNKHMSFIAQTIRTLRITVIFTAPSWGLIDGQVRNLMDYAIEVIGHDKADGITRFKFFVIEPSDKETPYRKHLVFDDEYGAPVKYMSWTLKAPSKTLTDQYEPVRNSYTKIMVSDADDTIKTGQDVRFGNKKKVKERPNLIEIAKQVVNDPSFYVNGKLQQAIIADRYKMGLRNVEQIFKLCNAYRSKPNQIH